MKNREKYSLRGAQELSAGVIFTEILQKLLEVASGGEKKWPQTFIKTVKSIDI